MLQFIYRARFMTSSLSNLVNSLSGGLHRIKSKLGHDDKKCRIKYKYSDYFLEYTNFKDDLIEYKYLSCNKSYRHKFDEELKERFFNAYNFSSFAKWLSVRFGTKWLWVQLPLQSLNLQIWCLLRARSSLTFRQL